MLLYFKIYFNNIEVISYSNNGNIGPTHVSLRELYEEKTLRTSEFLREVGNLFAPSVSRTAASSDSD